MIPQEAVRAYPGVGNKPISPPELRISRTTLFWRTQVRCPSHCPQVTDWSCTYLVEAHNAAVLGGGEDCCVDC